MLEQWPMRWSCTCGRTFTQSKLCLECGDRLPHWVDEGVITWDKRNKMSNAQYMKWVNEQQELEAEKLVRAVRDLSVMLTSLEH